MVVVDMPFGSYEGAPETAYANAARVMKETGAQAVKVEAGPTVAGDHRLPGPARHPGDGPRGPAAPGGAGRRRLQGQGPHQARSASASSPRPRRPPTAGAFAVVVEGVAEGLAREITEAVEVPTIGIGASAGCDGQILVTDDMLGLFDWTPKFVRRYADLRGEIGQAVGRLRRGRPRPAFPGPAETYFASSGTAGK